jgi:hypothetical protein
MLIKDSIASTIKLLAKLNDSLKEGDESNVNITVTQERKLEPVRKIGLETPIGFEQTGPIKISISIEDYRKTGTFLG